MVLNKNTLKDMKRTEKFLVVFTLLFTGLVYGQQDPHYTQYMYNQNILNPAYAGSRGDLSIGLLGRTQWVGIKGAPDSQTLNIHSAIGKGVGVGLSFINDQIGPAKESNVMLDLSYGLQVGANSMLSFGIKGSYNFLNVNLINGTVRNDDGDVLFYDNLTEKAPNVGAGLFFNTERFYAGISVPNILQNKIYTNTLGHTIQDVSDNIHFFATMGYVFDLSDNLKFKPSTMIKMVSGAPISFDLNGSLFINKTFEVGLSWREGDSIDAIIGVQASPQIRVGYAYDHTLTHLGDYNSGSHELMLLFDFDFAKKHIKSPRYF